MEAAGGCWCTGRDWRLLGGGHTQHSSSGLRQRLEAAGGRWGTGSTVAVASGTDWRLLGAAGVQAEFGGC